MRRTRRENVADAEAPLFEEIPELCVGGEPADGEIPGARQSRPPELRDLSESLSAIPLDWDDWELDDDLRRAEHLAHDVSPTTSAQVQAPPGLVPSAPPPLPARLPPPRKPRAEKSAVGHVVSWLVLSLGLMPFVCGVVLVGWSFFSGRADLWRIGVPLTLLGQTGWLVGMLLQLDGLWQSHRRASQSLEDVEVRLDELRETAALMSASHSGDARSFYAHFADGAGPSLLLADLKGQLDLLAMQLSRHRAA
jgi:hypothetical protein